MLLLCLGLSMAVSTLGTVAPSSLPDSLAPTLIDASSSSPSPSTSTLRTSLPSPNPSCCNPSQSTPSFPPNPTEPPVKVNTPPLLRWSLLFPLIAVSAVAWTFRETTRRCLCIIPTDSTMPEENIIDHVYATAGSRRHHDGDGSVVGDRDTDVELVPVRTLRSHDWAELGPDPMAGSSDYYSEAIADFVAMKDEAPDPNAS